MLNAVSSGNIQVGMISQQKIAVNTIQNFTTMPGSQRLDRILAF